MVLLSIVVGGEGLCVVFVGVVGMGEVGGVVGAGTVLFCTCGVFGSGVG